jgi:hypothetical protein
MAEGAYIIQERTRWEDSAAIVQEHSTTETSASSAHRCLH